MLDIAVVWKYEGSGQCLEGGPNLIIFPLSDLISQLMGPFQGSSYLISPIRPFVPVAFAPLASLAAALDSAECLLSSAHLPQCESNHFRRPTDVLLAQDQPALQSPRCSSAYGLCGSRERPRMAGEFMCSPCILFPALNGCMKSLAGRVGLPG